MSEYRIWARKLRDSDEEAFRDLFMESYNPLMRYAIIIVKDYDVACDILQEVYAHLWEIRERIDEEQSLKALLYRMTRNRCINHNRVKRMIRLDDIKVSENPRTELIPEGIEEDDGNDEELQHRLDEWIELLPTRQREAFELSRFEGLDHDEIAQVMECAPRTVNNHIVKALAALRDRLEQWRAENEKNY